MRRLSRIATVMAAASLLAVTQIGTAEAASQWPPPSDCTLSPVDQTGTESLTCTNRPATQQWKLTGWCFPFGRPVFRSGNIVTGNGTSTISCGTPELGPEGEQFVTLN